MKNLQISPQKTVAILQKELITNKNDLLQRVMCQKIFKNLKDEPYLLKVTGAKLFKNDTKYFIGGYAADGSDVDYYLK